MSKLFTTIVFFLTFLFTSTSVKGEETKIDISANRKPIKIGIATGYTNNINLDIRAFSIALTTHILEENNIQYEYVRDDWYELLKKIEDGSIDILPGTQFSNERKEYLDFIDKGLYSIWSQLYIHRNNKVISPTDLNNKKIGMITNEDSGIKFLEFISAFNIQVEPVYFYTVSELKEAFNKDEIFGVAGPMIKDFKSILPKSKPSGIFYNPTYISIAFTKNKYEELISLFNTFITNEVDDPKSYYNHLANEYDISPERNNSITLPIWAFPVIYSILAILIIVVFFNIWLQKTVKIKTVELVEAKNKAEESERLKSAFLANMSHEIRTPLNAIIGFSELISNEAIDQQQKQLYSSIIGTQNKLLLNLINDIIDISKIESGTLKIKSERINIQELLKDIYRSFLHQFPGNFSFILDLDSISEESTIDTDPNRLRQILNNFLTNTIKYTDGGTVTLGVNQISNNIEIWVKDSGEGISKEKQDLIFKRFTKIDELSQGAGLGLAISQSLALILGGNITLSSTPGIGSKFTFRIPAS